jgi:hypothetical protein
MKKLLFGLLGILFFAGASWADCQSVNLITTTAPRTWQDNTVTITSNGNGKYTLNGTLTANSTYTLANIDAFTIPASVDRGGTGSFYIGNPEILSTCKFIFKYDNDIIDTWSLSSTNRFTTSYSTMATKQVNNIAIQCTADTTVNNFSLSPAIYNDGRTTAGEFVPGCPNYDNSCRNLFDKDNITPIAGYIAATGTTWTGNSNGYSLRIPCKPNTKYTARYNGNSTQVVLSFGSTSTNDIPVGNGTVAVTQAIRQNNPTISTPITITTGANDKWLIVAYNKAEQQNIDMANNLQIEEGDTATAYVPFCSNLIKIATTAYNTAQFNPVVTDLNTTIATIRSVVTNTINQTKAIADLQAKKQTRPDEQCPAGKKCLLVEDNNGTPHWYEIIENADGYTELQYVVGGLIDTGLYIKTTDIYELKYATTQNSTAYQFGYRGQSGYDSANTFNATYSSGEAGVLYIVDSNRNLKQCQFTTPIDTPVVFSWKGSVNIAPSVNGSSISCTGTTTEQTNPTLTYIIGGQNIAGDPQNHKPIKLYYFKVFASDGVTLTHNFVPMRRNLDGIIGMYDTITGTFFQSANTNKPFTAGPEI